MNSATLMAPEPMTIRDLQRENALLRGQVSAGKFTTIQLASARRTLQKHGLLPADAGTGGSPDGLFLDRADLQLVVRCLTALSRAGQVKLDMAGDESPVPPSKIVPINEAPSFRALLDLFAGKTDLR